MGNKSDPGYEVRKRDLASVDIKCRKQRELIWAMNSSREIYISCSVDKIFSEIQNYLCNVYANQA